MIIAAALALLLPSTTNPMVFSCKVKTFQDTELSIVIDSAEVIDRRGGNWVNTDSGRVKIVADNDQFLRGGADLMELDGNSEPRRAVVRVVRQGQPPFLTVLDLQVSKTEASDSYDLAVVQWGLHGERLERGTGTCTRKVEQAQ